MNTVEAVAVVVVVDIVVVAAVVVVVVLVHFLQGTCYWRVFLMEED